MSLRSIVPALVTTAVLVAATPAAAGNTPDFAPRHVVVRYDSDSSRTDRARVQNATGTRFDEDLPGGARTLKIKDGESVKTTLAGPKKFHCSLRQPPTSSALPGSLGTNADAWTS